MDTQSLIERLRYRVNNPSAWSEFEQSGSDLCATAASTLASQAAEIERLREALKPFANHMDDGMDCNYIGEPLPDADGVGWVYLTHGDLRRARAALNGEKP